MNESITIGIKSTPFAGDGEGATEFYEALGRVVCLWGRFEYVLTTDLLVISNLPGAEALRRPLPISWKRKVSLWSDAFKTLPALEGWKEAGLQFIADANDVAQDRHVLQHSHWWGFQSRDPLLSEFSMIRQRKDKIVFLSYKVTLDLLHETINKIDSLNCRLLPLSFKLGSLQPPFLKAPDKSS